MAIKRCPYCRAIIDESDRYCINCGTQLLFPEDELVEEEIPGEKIIETEEKEGGEEKIVLEEPETEASESPPAPATPSHVTFNFPEKTSLLESSEDSVEWGPEEKESLRKTMVPWKKPPAKPPLDVEKEAASILEKERKGREDEEEFQETIPSSREELEEIKRLIASSGKESRVPGPTPFGEKDFEALKRKGEETSGEIEKFPEWAERSRGGETPPFPGGKEKETDSRDLAEFSQEREESDLGEGDREESAELDREEEWTEERGERPQSMLFSEYGDQESAGSRRRGRKRGGFLGGLKGKVYDVLFVTLFWVIGVLAASRVLSVPVLRIFELTLLPVMAFYGILLVAYFFLFLFFLGETPGDRVASLSS